MLQFIVSLAGTLLPLLVLAIFLVANPSKWTGGYLFIQDGQFLLFSASLLSPASYIFYTWKLRNTDWKSIMFLISIALIIGVSILYGYKISGMFENIAFLGYSSILTFILTLIFYYVALYHQGTVLNIPEAQNKAIKNILNDLP